MKLLRLLINGLVRAAAWCEGRDRADYALLVGIAILAAAAARAWYRIPSPTETGISADGRLDIHDTELPVTLVLRAGVGMFAAVTAVVAVHDVRATRLLRRFAWVLLAMVLVVPLTELLWQPDFLDQSHVIYDQIDRVTNDIEENAQELQRDWRDYQLFHPTFRWDGGEPGQAAWSLDMLGLSGQIQIVELLGLSNAFLNVAGFGWYAAISGLAVLLLAIYSGSDQGRRDLRFDGWFVVAAFAGVFATQLVPRGIAEYHEQQAERAMAEGADTSALREFGAAAAWIPSLQVSLELRAKIGAITYRRNCVSCPETQLYLAQQAINQGSYAKALADLNKADALAPDLPGLSHWISSASVEVGMDLFNNGQYTAADQMFVRALSQTPADPLAWYGRSIIALRLRDFDAAARDLEQVVRLQSYLDFRRYPPRSQFLLARSWNAYNHGDYALAHELISMSLTPAGW